MSWNKESFREKIESEHSFPGTYIFKFIIASGQKQQVLDMLPDGELSFRNSSNNAYVSITLKALMKESNDVIDVYEKVYEINGIVAL